MKNKLFAIFVFIVVFSSIKAQEIFHKSYNLYDMTNAYDIQQTPDEGFIITGEVKKAGQESHLFLIKTNKDGDTSWTKIYSNGTLTEQKGTSVIYTNDGGYLISVRAKNGSNYYAKAVKTNSLGNISWEKSYGNNNQYSEFNDMLELSDGFVFSGFIYSNTGTGNDVLLIKTNKSGDTLWTKTYGGLAYDHGFSLDNTTDGGFIIAGNTQSFGVGGYDAYLIKTNSTGNLSWTKTYGGNNDEYAYSVQQTNDGGYIIGGYTKSFGKGNEDFYLIKTNSTGDTTWTKTYGGTKLDIARNVFQLSNGAYLLSGYSKSFNSYESDYYFLKTDANGIKLWEKTYGFPSFVVDELYSALQTIDGGFVFVGTSKKTTLEADAYVVKTDMNGCAILPPEIKAIGESKPGIFCEGTTLTLKTEITYASYFWSNGSGDAQINIDSSGEFFVKVIDNFGCIAFSDTPSFRMFPKPLIDITVDGKLEYCPGTFDSLNLHATKGYTSYLWNPPSNDTFADYTAKSFGTHKVYVTDSNGCKNNSSVTIKKYSPFDGENICVVTVDTNTNKNLIAWERTGGERTAYYKVYKETTQAGIYNQIGSVPFKDVSVFVDKNSNPFVKADRYKISAVDSCGTESQLSSFHKTMHLNANEGTSGEVNLIWEHYEGFVFATYKIYRGTSPSNLQLIDSIQSNLFSWTDVNPPSSAVYYKVAVVMPDTCYPTHVRAGTTSGPFSQSLSNLKDYGVSRPDYFDVMPQSVILDSGKDSITINIFTNLKDWSISHGKSWLNVEKDEFNKIITISSSVNFKNVDRVDTIFLSAGDLEVKTIIVTQSAMSSIEEGKLVNSIKIYPNPFTEETNIAYKLKTVANVNIEVYNSFGKKIETLADYEQKPGNYVLSFNPKQHSDGLYFIKLQFNNKVLIRKILKF